MNKIIITKSIGPRPANHHILRFLRIEPHRVTSNIWVESCQILIQRFRHLRTRKRTRSDLTIQMHELTLKLICTSCFLSLRNTGTIVKNYPLTPIDLSLYNRHQRLSLLNAAEHDFLPCFQYENWEGGSRLLPSRKLLNFPATIFSNAFEKTEAREIGI